MSDDDPIVHEHADRTLYDLLDTSRGKGMPIMIGGPLKPGVAYMPVPRCDQCRHWHHDRPADIRGMCMISGNVEVPDAPFAAGDGFVETRGDFGCVQFEAKP